jgi:hypothetical protein
LKVTVPVGVPEAPGATVAVKVVELPEKMGFALDAKEMLVDSCTISVRAKDVFGATLLLPL